MRSYIITEREREIIKAFLERGERLEGFRTLLSRLRKLELQDVDHQVKLIKQFLAKVEKKA